MSTYLHVFLSENLPINEQFAAKAAIAAIPANITDSRLTEHNSGDDNPRNASVIVVKHDDNMEVYEKVRRVQGVGCVLRTAY